MSETNHQGLLRTHKSASTVPRLSEFSYDHAVPSVPGWYAVRSPDRGYEVVRVTPMNGVLIVHSPNDHFDYVPEDIINAEEFFGPLLFRLEEDA